MTESDVRETSPSQAPAGKQPGLNDMAEDMFGLSIRGLTTINDAITRPAAVFTAARLPDWGGRYTPTLRLVTSIIAVMMLLRIFWAAESSSMYQMVVVQLEQLAEQVPELATSDNLADVYFNAWAVVFPFVYLAMHLIVAFATRIWGKGTSAVSRIRLYFAALVPGLIFGIASVLVMPFISLEALTPMTIIGMALSLLIYAVTVFFGLSPVFPSRGARIWRATLFSLIVTVTDLATSIISNFIGGIWMGMSAATGG